MRTILSKSLYKCFEICFQYFECVFPYKENNGVNVGDIMHKNDIPSCVIPSG
jgi:hypothetical protein